MDRGATETSAPAQRQRGARTSRVDVDGWLILDKPVGMTSTHAVSRLRRLFNAKKAGHAGTLDPLASGVLPIAFGEATKTVPYVQEGEKTYRFTVKWGEETDSDDADGKVVRVSRSRPKSDQIFEILPRFIGDIMQTPPAFSAIKVAGERAYDIARDGEQVVLNPRPITIHSLELVSSEGDLTIFEAQCGKGAYVRALARDLGRALDCFGHVAALRRTRVGPFYATEAAAVAELEKDPRTLAQSLLGVEAGLAELFCVVVDRDGASRLRRGQPLILRGRDAPVEGPAYAACGGVVVAIGCIEAGELRPTRVFNLAI